MFIVRTTVRHELIQGGHIVVVEHICDEGDGGEEDCGHERPRRVAAIFV